MKIFPLITILLAVPLLIRAEGNFERYFEDSTLRFDFFHSGNANSEEFTEDRLYNYGVWASSKKNLIDEFNNGEYYVKLFLPGGGKLLYSRGYCTYFSEYASSDQAIAGKKKTFHETVLTPFPKQKVRLSIEKRMRDGKFSEVYSAEIDPADRGILKKNFHDPSAEVFQVMNNGKPSEKTDLLIIGEGYSKNDRALFKKDLEHFSKLIFSQEPYASMKKAFNLNGIFKPSAESGISEPQNGIFKNSLLSATFNSLNSERYILTEDNKTLRDIAANRPYDAIIIMVNHSGYGGGGIYNLYCTFTAHNEWADYLLLHEFGHSFSGLADEYYTSDVAYNDYYPKGVEPSEPNITALLGGKLKWEEFLSPGTEVPTKWDKGIYDSTDMRYQRQRREMNKKISEMKRAKASEVEIERLQQAYRSLDIKHASVIDSLLHKSKYSGKVGAFEGAGYASGGLYRPELDCIMFSKGKKPYCTVCAGAIIKMIEYHEGR